MIDSKHILKTTTLLVALSTGSAALANDARVERETNSVTVSFAELDLTKTAGVEVLYSRLQKAAEHVCGVGARSLISLTASSRSEKAECYQMTLSKTVASLDMEALTEKHSS